MRLAVLDLRMDKEPHMATTSPDAHSVDYQSPPWAQRWFLKRSRDNWKEKYMALKSDAKRLENRVTDVTKSRAKWCAQTKHLAERVQTLEAENAALQEQLAALKKDGHAGA
jgi:hypothetical protein